MKKLLALALFAFVSIFFKAEATNWEKVGYGAGTAISAATTVGTILIACKKVPELWFGCYISLALNAASANGYQKDLSGIGGGFLLITAMGIAVPVLSAYLTKKCYDKYQEASRRQS